MKIILFGAGGFIGINLTIELAKDERNEITLIDRSMDFFENIKQLNLKNIKIIASDFTEETDFDELVSGHDIVYHLVSTTIPTTSNQQIPQELLANVVVTSKMLESCIRNNIQKVVFLSSGGTVYGKESKCPLNENTPTNPISSYGIQKVTIEKLMYLYQYMFGLEYRIIRLANPYGPYQRPNGILGAVTTFTYKAIKNEEILVYGDGSVVRDFIYIDDAIRGILNIVNGESKHRVFNLGCGYGTSIIELLDTIQSGLGLRMNIKYIEGRKVDVPVNYLDISRYEAAYGQLNPISLHEGVSKTANFMRKHYDI